jgi:hypothetical protein
MAFRAGVSHFASGDVQRRVQVDTPWRL